MNGPKLKVEYRSVDELLPYANNSKEHTDKQVRQIANSIDQFGNCDPVGVWTRPDGQLEIVEGHGRVLALKELGIKDVPCIRLDHLDDDARRAYSHVHNQLTMNTGFDMEKLAQDVQELTDFDWQELGFKASQIEELESIDHIQDDEAVQLDYTTDPKSHRGDLFRLGDHYLLCGDATDAADQERIAEIGAGGGVRHGSHRPAL